MNASWMLALTPVLATTEIACDIQKCQHNYVLIQDQATIPLLTPSMQKRQIAKIRLDNGIEAYIISDPDLKHSAASVAIKAGSWNDPKEYPGMAHFVEHVVFMGTEAYPGENDFSQYISECSGKYNAFTASDRTVYMLSVNHDGFVGALDRLSHFFINPLLCTATIDRELLAIDQEFAKNIEHDGWRQYMILKQTGNPQHPNSGFSIGNANTLRGIPQEALRSWFAKNYTPDHMRVVILSPLPKEQLIQLVAERFSAVSKNTSSSSVIESNVRMLSKQQQGALIAIKPIRDMKELSLVWELPSSFTEHDAETAAQLLSYVLNSPHEGGLVDMLKEAGWVQEARSAYQRHSTEEMLFMCNFDLTEEGVHNKEKIIQKTFETLAQVRQSSVSDLFDEMKKLDTLHYQYQTRQSAFDMIQRLGQKMFDEDLATFPEQSMIAGNFAPDLFEELLDCLSPKKCCFMLTADPALSSYTPDQKEQWMGAEFTIVPIEEKSLTAWQNVKSEGNSQIPLNPFVPQHLAFLQKETTKMDTPSLVVASDQAKIYYQQDAIYEVPEVAMVFRVHTPAIDGSARSAVLADFFCKAFQEKLRSTLYMASSAGLRASLYPGHHFIGVVLDGYSEKAPKLASLLFAKLKKLKTSEEKFAIYKEMFQSIYANASKELPCWQGKEIVDNLLLSATPTQQQKLDALKEITYKDFELFSEELFQRAFVEGLIYGNCESEEAISISSQLSTALNAAPLKEENIGKRKVRLLPAEQGPFLVVEPTVSMGKAAILAIQQGPFSYDARAKQLIAGSFLHELFFDRLRTKQQTAYIALARERDFEGQLMQLFLVQSNSHQPQELLARFDLFLDELDQEFEQLITADRFEKARYMLIQELTLPPENLQAMAQRLATLAFERNADFSFYSNTIASIKKLSYGDVKDFIHKTLSRDNTRRLAVLVEGKLQTKREFIYKRTAKEEIGSIGELESRDLR